MVSLEDEPVAEDPMVPVEDGPEDLVGAEDPEAAELFFSESSEGKSEPDPEAGGGWKGQGATHQTLSRTPGSMVEEARNRQLTQFPSWMSPISSMR